MHRYLPLLFTLFLIPACTFDSKKEAQKEEEGPAPSQFVEYRLEQIQKTTAKTEGDTSSQSGVNFRIDYPVITNGPVDSVINRINDNIKSAIFQYAFVEERPESFETLMDEITAEYKEIVVDFPDYNQSWSLEISSDILHQSERYVSIASTIFSYTGGAHPNSSLVYRSYDLNTGKPVLLEDILVEKGGEQLNEAAEIEFRMDHEIPPAEKLSEAGYFFAEDKFQLNNNFVIIDNSLIFYFNSYEISSYAQGPTELELKLTDYKNLIKPGSVIDHE